MGVVLKRCLLAAAVSVTALFAGAQAFAANPVDPLLHPGTNQLSDDSAELFIDHTGSPTTVNVNDVFVAIIGMNTINSTVVGGASPNNELTGLFALKVTGVSFTGLLGGACGASATLVASCSLFTFAPVNDFAAEFLSAGVVVPAQAAGTFALIFEDGGNDFTLNGATFAGIAANANEGTPRMVLSIVDGQITAIAPANLAVIAPLAEGAGIGSFVGSATIVSETFTLNFDPTVQITGNVSRPAAGQPSQVRDDATFTLIAVPEPKTASLLGSGLLILGLLALRRRKDAREA